MQIIKNVHSIWLVAMAPPLIRLGMLIEFATISYNSVLLGFSRLFSIQIFSYKRIFNCLVGIIRIFA